jgi:energy-coupling factor transporter ATP-binding protein EcfA2
MPWPGPDLARFETFSLAGAQPWRAWARLVQAVKVKGILWWTAVPAGIVNPPLSGPEGSVRTAASLGRPAPPNPRRREAIRPEASTWPPSLDRILWGVSGGLDLRGLRDPSHLRRTETSIRRFLAWQGVTIRWTCAGDRLPLRERFLAFGGRLSLIPSPRRDVVPTGRVQPWLEITVGDPPGSVPVQDAARPTIVVGTTAYGAPLRTLWSLTEGHHTLIVGETGMGKTTLMLQLLEQVALTSAAILWFDPQGDSLERVRAHLPRDRGRPPIWLRPDPHTPGINVFDMGLSPPTAEVTWERERRAAELVSALRYVRSASYEAGSFWGPRMEDILRRTFRTLTQVPGATLEQAVQILEDPEGFARDPGSGPVTSPEVFEMLAHLARVPPEDREGSARLLREAVGNPALLHFLSDPESGRRLADSLQPGAITLIDLARGRLGERASRFLGTLLLALIWSEIQARRTQAKVVLFLDEAQEYESEALRDLLRLGRRLNVHAVLSTQSLSNLDEALRDTLVTNARDLIFFRGSPRDRALFEAVLDTGGEISRSPLRRLEGLALLDKCPPLTVFRIGRAWELGGPPSGVPPPPAPSPGLNSSNERPHEKSPWPSDPNLRETAPNPSNPDFEGLYTRFCQTFLTGTSASGAPTRLALSVGEVRDFVGGDERLLRRLGRSLRRDGLLLGIHGSRSSRVWILSSGTPPDGRTPLSPTPRNPDQDVC